MDPSNRKQKEASTVDEKDDSTTFGAPPPDLPPVALSSTSLGVDASVEFPGGFTPTSPLVEPVCDEHLQVDVEKFSEVEQLFSNVRKLQELDESLMQCVADRYGTVNLPYYEEKYQLSFGKFLGIFLQSAAIKNEARYPGMLTLCTRIDKILSRISDYLPFEIFKDKKRIRELEQKVQQYQIETKQLQDELKQVKEAKSGLEGKLERLASAFERKLIADQEYEEVVKTVLDE